MCLKFASDIKIPLMVQPLTLTHQSQNTTHYSHITITARSMTRSKYIQKSVLQAFHLYKLVLMGDTEQEMPDVWKRTLR